jgi:hypothetical protein
MSTRITYQDRSFSNYTALAEYLAPLTGRSFEALRAALYRHQGDATRVIRPPGPSKSPIPCIYQGWQFPSSSALATYLAPLTGLKRESLQVLLSKYDGNVERILARSMPPA